MSSCVIRDRLWEEGRKKETKLSLAEVAPSHEVVFWRYSGVITVVPLMK